MSSCRQRKTSLQLFASSLTAVKVPVLFSISLDRSLGFISFFCLIPPISLHNGTILPINIRIRHPPRGRQCPVPVLRTDVQPRGTSTASPPRAAECAERFELVSRALQRWFVSPPSHIHLQRPLLSSFLPFPYKIPLHTTTAIKIPSLPKQAQKTDFNLPSALLKLPVSRHTGLRTLPAPLPVSAPHVRGEIRVGGREGGLYFEGRI